MNTKFVFERQRPIIDEVAQPLRTDFRAFGRGIDPLDTQRKHPGGIARRVLFG